MRRCIPEAVDGALCGLAQICFQLCEGLLDRVEIGAVGRQEPEPGTDAFDGGAHGGCIVARQVVHDDHVAADWLGHKDASEVGEQCVGINRSIARPCRCGAARL